MSAPSSLISAKAKGRSKGWPGIGSATQDQVWTVPTSETSTHSESGSLVFGSNSAGGTITRRSEPRTPTTLPDRSSVRKRPMIGPVERV